MAVTGGGGAAKVVVDIINAQWEQAKTKSDGGEKYIANAGQAAVPAPKMDVAGIEGGEDPPSPPALPPESLQDGERIYNEQLDKLLEFTQQWMNDFVEKFFPNPEFFQHAAEWVDRAITQGGTGINANVENALWQRARAKILGDSERAENEAMSMWANKRFPLPPGVLVGLMNTIGLDTGRKLAEQSRDISIKSFDTEIENVRMSVKLALDQRKIALDAMGDYIKTMMMAPATAKDLAVGLSQLHSEAAKTMVAMYAAQINGYQAVSQISIADATLKQSAQKANLDSQVNSVNERVKAALQGAQMFGTQAASGFNAVSGQAQISGMDTSQV